MKIILVNDYGYHVGGAETHFFELAQQLKLAGHEVITVSSDYLSIKKTFLTDYQLPRSGSIKELDRIFHYSQYKEFKKILKKFNPDVVHFHNILSQLSLFLILAASSSHTILTLHDYRLICDGDKRDITGKICTNSYSSCVGCKCATPVTRIGALTRKLAKFFINKIDNIIAPSTFIKEQFELNRFKNISLLPHACANTSSIELEKKKYEGRPYFLYIGRLAEQKGLSMLIDAYAQSNIDDIDLYIAGLGPEDENLKSQVEQLGLGSKISFLGYVSGEYKEQLLQNCLANIVPSIWPEVVGLSIYEAAIYAKPTIATAVGGITDFIEDGRTGVLMPNDEVQWGECLMRIAENKLFLSDCGLNARSKILLQSYKIFLGNYIEIIKNNTVNKNE